MPDVPPPPHGCVHGWPRRSVSTIQRHNPDLWVSCTPATLPSTRILRDAGLFGAMISVLESGAWPNRQCTIDPLGHTLTSHVKTARNLGDGFAGVIASEDLRPLDFAKRSRGRST